VAALAPTIVAALPGPRIPQVVVLIFCGIIIGPSGLGLGNTTSIRLLSNVGLGFLFLLAGYELDASLLRARAGKLAITGWAISALLAVATVGALGSFGFVRDYVPIGLALTTTALGTLLPILKDNEMLSGQFGRYVLAAGAVGELFPIIAISLFLTRRGEFIATLSILLVFAAGLALAVAPRLLGHARLEAIIRQGRRATAQTTLRWSIVLLIALLVIAARFGLDVVLGAVIAGVVLRNWTRRMGVDVEPLESKLDAVGYGLFIPIFFVASGMTLDVHSIIRNPARLLIFLALLLIVRGLPSLVVYRRALPLRQRLEMTFITATTMPLLIAIAAIGLIDGVMLPANAAALVGAGVLSVLIYPLAALVLHRGDPQRVSITPSEPAESSESAEPGQPPGPASSADPPAPGLPGLPQAGDPLADSDAHGRRPPAAAAPAQLMQQRGDNPCSRAAERVADCDRAAVDVDQVGVELQLVGHGHRLGGKRLVDLDQREIAQLPARPGQHPGHGRYRADAHVVRVHAGADRSRVPGQRLGAGRGHRPLRHQDQR
jgi:Kef-type K+ transport system membrane component KefB